MSIESSPRKRRFGRSTRHIIQNPAVDIHTAYVRRTRWHFVSRSFRAREHWRNVPRIARSLKPDQIDVPIETAFKRWSALTKCYTSPFRRCTIHRIGCIVVVFPFSPNDLSSSLHSRAHTHTHTPHASCRRVVQITIRKTAIFYTGLRARRFFFLSPCVIHTRAHTLTRTNKMKNRSPVIFGENNKRLVVIAFAAIAAIVGGNTSRRRASVFYDCSVRACRRGEQKEKIL